MGGVLMRVTEADKAIIDMLDTEECTAPVVDERVTIHLARRPGAIRFDQIELSKTAIGDPRLTYDCEYCVTEIHDVSVLRSMRDWLVVNVRD